MSIAGKYSLTKAQKMISVSAALRKTEFRVKTTWH